MSRQAALLGMRHAKEHAQLDARLFKIEDPRPIAAYEKLGGDPYVHSYLETYRLEFRITMGQGLAYLGRRDGAAHGRSDAAGGARKNLRPSVWRALISDEYLTNYRETYHLNFDLEKRVQAELQYRKELKERLTPETTLNTRELRAIELQRQKDQVHEKAQRELER